MYKITQVKIGFSENPKIARAVKCYDLSDPAKVIALLEETDLEVSRSAEKGYDKTDVSIVWENGDEYALRYDLGDGISIADRLNPAKRLADWIARKGEQNIPLSCRQGMEEAIAFLADKQITV